MITPEYLNEIMYGVEDKLQEANYFILKRIAERVMQTFKAGEDKLFIPATRNDLVKLLQNGVLIEEVQEALTKMLPGMDKAIKEAFYQSADEINRQNIDIAKKIVDFEGLSSVNVPEYEQVGIISKASQLHMTAAEIRQLEEAYKRTKGEVHNLTRTTAIKAQQSYIEACDSAYMRVKSGVSVQTAICEAIKELADRGIDVVNYRGGKTESMEVAVARSVRTGVNQANSNIVLTRCAEMGVGYVKVSAHMGARVTKQEDYTNHSWWQGRVYKVDYSSDQMEQYTPKQEKGFEWLDTMRESMPAKEYDYPDFEESTGYGNMLGIAGINCRHSFYPFYPGIQLNDDDRPDMEENEKRYNLDQKQRAMERSIRKTRRELETVKSIKSDDPEIVAFKQNIRKRLKDQSDMYLAFCSDNNLKPRNYSMKVK